MPRTGLGSSTHVLEYHGRYRVNRNMEHARRWTLVFYLWNKNGNKLCILRGSATMSTTHRNFEGSHVSTRLSRIGPHPFFFLTVSTSSKSMTVSNVIHMSFSANSGEKSLGSYPSPQSILVKLVSPTLVLENHKHSFQKTLGDVPSRRERYLRSRILKDWIF